ncbi:hypothetical protein GAZ26_27575 [Bacteroides xylanisolvens]|uniref:Uncharacterized protein n=2 Tax=Bacteria TaxID=2 RepID=A0A7J5QIF1_9BACE|nr:hypothetical protein [Bacteroides xylanisolvens]KAB6414860.1 hypothetical protein GAZ26_27575 [Bacteroides xylanisolvens]
MELRRNEKITFRCTELEKDALAEQAARCSLSVSEYCRSLSGEPMHEVFSNLAAAEMYSCAIRGKENVEWVEVSEEEAIDLDELKDMFPDDFCGV